ncbi:MAG: FAD-dependent thymidylate synthase, partial [Oxalobacteraceae bacterium]
MTKQLEILHDPKYISVLDQGFVGLVDHMGSDADIVSAARVSYGDGTKSVNQDRGLIRYLVSHRHTSPIEMAEVKLHIKMPIFIMRQWVRHRTASLNEYSGRYSIMSDEFYRPGSEALAPQSQVNNQGRAGSFTDKELEGVQTLMGAAFDTAYHAYSTLVTPATELEQPRDAFLDPYDPSDYGYFDDSYPGLARELARTVMPVANYTELYWKQDLHNLLHLIKLRRDSHAQKEIQAYAEAVYTLIKPLFPLTIEAWEDYVWYGTNLSRMDGELLQTLLTSNSGTIDEM